MLLKYSIRLGKSLQLPVNLSQNLAFLLPKRRKSSVRLLTWSGNSLWYCWVSDCPSCFTLHFLETGGKVGISVCHIKFHPETLWGWKVIYNDEAKSSKWYCKLPQLTHGWSRTHSDGFPSHPIELHSEVLKTTSKYLSVFPYWELKLCRWRWGVRARASLVCFCELLFLLPNSITWNEMLIGVLNSVLHKMQPKAEDLNKL